MKKLGDNEVNRPVPWEELTGETDDLSRPRWRSTRPWWIEWILNRRCWINPGDGESEKHDDPVLFDNGGER